MVHVRVDGLLACQGVHNSSRQPSRGEEGVACHAPVVSPDLAHGLVKALCEIAQQLRRALDKRDEIVDNVFQRGRGDGIKGCFQRPAAVVEMKH